MRRELELPDGATGLDAARAIGPKLAEQAVLVKADGVPQDLRLPLPDGRELQILTTRDTADPDALAVLRHSAAHLLAEAVRRLYPGRQGRDRAADRERLLLRLRLPDADQRGRPRGDRGRGAARARRGPRLGARGDLGRRGARSDSRPRASRTRSSSSTPPTAPSPSTRRATSPTSAAGPHLQTSAPIKAFKLTSLAGAYWRGDSANTQLTRIYGTAFFTQKELDESLALLEEARARDHRRLGNAARPLPLRRALAGVAVLASEGDGDLQHARGPAPARERAPRLLRGEDAADLRQGALGDLGPLGEVPREHVPDPDRRRAHVRVKPMNCPGHMLLFGSQLRSYRDLPLRYAEAAPLHRNELAGALHGLTRVRYVTQDDAHIFCSREQVDAELDGALEYLRYLYGLFGIEPRAELSTRPDNKLGTDEEWDFTEGKLVEALDRHAIEYFVGRGRRLVLRAEDRPPHDRRRSAGRGSSGRSSSTPRCRRASVSRTWGRTTSEHPVFVIHRALLRLVRALHRDPHRALRRRVPALARARPGARAAGRASSTGTARSRSSSGSRPRVSASSSTSATRRSVSGSATARSRRSRSWSSSASASRRTTLAVRTRGEGQSTRSLDELLARAPGGTRRRRDVRETPHQRSVAASRPPCYA